MEFVKVRHEDGREADITPAEVASYRSMGFEPIDAAAAKSAAATYTPSAANDQPMAAANGTDQRLDLVIDELRGLRRDLAGWYGEGEPEAAPEDGATVELREQGEARPSPISTSVVTDADGNVIARARGIEAAQPAATTTTSTTTPAPSTTTTSTTTVAPATTTAAPKR